MGSACSSQDASREPGEGPSTTSGNTMGQTQSGRASRRRGQFKECQLPGCPNSVYVDPRSNKVFDHCCRGHAVLHQNTSQPGRPSSADISDFQQECLLTGCKLMGSVDKTTGVRYDYCSKAHADEAAMRMFGVAPDMGCTTTTMGNTGLRAPSSGGGGGTFLPPCKHNGCTRPCAADADTGLVHDVCQAHSSGAAKSNTYSVAGGTSSTQAPTRATMGGTVGIIRIATVARAAPPPPSASSASGLFARPSAVSTGQCQLDGCAKMSAVDASTGQRHDFCCRHHAQQAKNPGKAGLFNSSGAFSAVPGSAVCMLPGCVKPQASGYDHCCKDHALAARKYIPMCMLSGCVQDAWFDPKRNQYSSYCGRAHRSKGERVLDEMTGGSGGSGFRLQELDRSHDKYESVKTQFTYKWQKNSNVPTVEYIFLIKMPIGVVDKYLKYKNRVGNERRRFHGTSRAPDCNFFTDRKKRPCSSQTCVACNICMVGFKLVGTTQKSYARYGRGLYFSSVSGKSNDYADGSEQMRNGARYRTMFLCNVAVGKAKVTEAVDLPHDQCPGSGFDSVVGNKGANLNYDETVVYNEAAAIPSYMIVYRM